jgi:hypothetical protein
MRDERIASLFVIVRAIGVRREVLRRRGRRGRRRRRRSILLKRLNSRDKPIILILGHILHVVVLGVLAGPLHRPEQIPELARLPIGLLGKASLLALGNLLEEVRERRAISRFLVLALEDQGAEIFFDPCVVLSAYAPAVRLAVASPVVGSESHGDHGVAYPELGDDCFHLDGRNEVLLAERSTGRKREREKRGGFDSQSGRSERGLSKCRIGRRLHSCRGQTCRR